MIKTIKNNCFLLKYVWKYCPGYFLLKIVTAFLAPIQPLIFMIVMKFAIDGVVQKKAFKEIIIMVSIGFIAVVIATIITNAINCGSELVASKIISGKLQKELLEKVQKIDYACYDQVEFYDKYTRALAETEKRAVDVLNTFIAILSNLLSLITVISILSILSPIVIIICACLIAVNFRLNHKKNQFDYKFNSDMIYTNRLIAYIKKIFYEQEFAQEIRLGKLGPLMRKKFDETIIIQKKVIRKHRIPNVLFNIGFNMVGYLLTFSIMGISCWQIMIGKISLGDFAALLNGAEQLFMKFYGLLGSISVMKQHSLFIDNLIFILNYNPIIRDDLSSKHLPINIHGDIHLNNVSFAYPNSDTCILKNIELKIKKGSKVAIVGYNGAGKSTLIKILLRLYDPTEGIIKFNDVNYQELRVSDLRNQFSVVFQDYKAYALSIAENITLNKELDEEMKINLYRAIKESGLENKVLSLNEGINTILSKEFDEKGILLSKGEQQKIAIARAIYDTHNILVFDEPSSALDPIAEYEFSNIIDKLSDEKTIIMISHRLSTIKMFDEIHMIEDGKIVESGTHDSLMLIKGKYYEMFTKQASNYELKEESKDS